MKKKNSKRLALIVVGLLLLTVLSVVLVFAPWRVQGAEPALIEKSEGMEDTGDSPEENEKNDRMTILLAGTDRTSGLSDVMMLVSLDRNTGEVWILQLPRDTYVNCGKGSYRKLNGVPSALDGMGETCDFLSESLGIPIHRYLRISPDAFRQAIDAIGGVEIELEQALDYEDPAQGLSIHLPAGKQTLDGAAAEQFVRFRSDYLRGDLGRMDAQKLFLAALFDRIRTDLSPVTVAKLGITLLGKVETNLSLPDLLYLTGDLPALQAEKIYFLTAPGSDVTATTGGSFYVLSAPAMNEILEHSFGGEADGFDKNRVFLYKKSKDFSRIYESYSDYEVVTATGIRENGLGIPRKE